MLNPDVNVMHDVVVDGEQESRIDALVDVLWKEVEVYRELRQTMEEEHLVLLNPSIEMLHESNARKETCILKIRILEELRVRVLGKIAAALGLDERDITLQSLLPYIQGDLYRALLECRTELYSLLTYIHEKNHRNQVLLDASLSSVRTTRHFIANLIGGGSTYRGSGELNNGSLSGRIYSERG